MKKKKEITIEDLAVMVQKGFVEAKKDSDKKFEGIDRKFEGVDKKFEGVYKRLDKLESNQKEILKKLDNKVDRFEFRELKHRVEDLELKASWGK